MICVQCTMKAIIQGKTPEFFDETLESHMRRLHPDPRKAAEERQEMVKELRDRLARQGVSRAS